MTTSSDRAIEIRDTALQAVADRITGLGSAFPLAVIPIVAANVAMASCLDQLLSDFGASTEELMCDIADACAPHAMWKRPEADR